MVRELGGEMAVLDPSPAIMRIFKLAGMDRLIRIEKSESISTRERENAEEGREKNESQERDQK